MTSQSEATPQFCTACGSPLPSAAEWCTQCGTRVDGATPRGEDLRTLVTLTEWADEWHRVGLIDRTSHARVLQHLAERIAVIRNVATATPESAASAPLPAAAPEPSVDLGAWAAERQADILLYLGSFFLVIAAVIFVTYQGDALGPTLRVTLLCAYTVAFIVAGLLVHRWAVIREAGRVLLAIGALLTPLNFVFFYTEVLGEGGVPADFVWLIGSVSTGLLYGGLAERGLGALYAPLAGLAGFSAWAALASVLNIPAEWVPAWFMAGALGLTAGLKATDRLDTSALASLAVLATLSALGASMAAVSELHHLQLPVTYALFAAFIAFAGVDQRALAALPLVVTMSLAVVITALWAAGVPAHWSAYPTLALGGATLASRHWWSPWSDNLVRFGWAYVGSLAFTAAFIALAAPRDGHATVTYAGGAALLAAVAWLDRRLGAFTESDDERGAGTPTHWAERVGFGWSAFILLLASIASIQEWLSIGEPDDGWAFVGLSVAVVGVLAWAVRRDVRWEWWLLPAALVSTLVALQPWQVHAGHNAVSLAITAIAIAAAAAWARLWGSALVSAVLIVAAAAAAWFAFSWSTWTLAVTYSAVGVAPFVLLTPRRDYEATSRARVVEVSPTIALSWMGAVLGLLTALVAVGQVAGDASTVVETLEYRVLIATILAISPLVAYEAHRHRLPLGFIAATAIALTAGLMTIGIAEPSNVQAYTIPVALYLTVLGIVVRRSRIVAAPIWPPHLYLHEAIVLAGMATLVLPQVEQSFAPGGARWGFVLLAEGAAFLGVGIWLRSRWMAVSGVLTLSGVALRWLLERGDTIPYWITLGLAGLLLLALGVLLLLRRDWWDGARSRAERWWHEVPT